MKSPSDRKKPLLAKDIVVGQIYKNSGYPGTVYLGCGKSRDYPLGGSKPFDLYSNKHLVIINSPCGQCDAPALGHQVYLKNNDFSRNFILLYSRLDNVRLD